jgi:hypothetical protein
MFTRRCLISLFVFFALLESVPAQETSALQGGIRYGISGNVGVNLHSVRFLTMPGSIRETIDNNAPNLDYSYISGVGLHSTGGIFAEFPLLSWLNLGTHLSFQNKSGLLESRIISTPAGRSDGTETTLRSVRRMDVTLQTWGTELMLGITPIQGFNIYAGLRGDIAYLKNFSQREEIQPDTDGAFENGLRVRNQAEGELPEVRNLGIANFNAAFTGGFGGEFALGNTRAFSVEVRILGDVGIFNVFQRMELPNEWWRVNSIKAGLAVRYYPEREKALSEIESRLERIQALEKAVVSERTKIQEELKELKQSGLSASIGSVVGKTFSGSTVENPRIGLEKTLVARSVEWKPSLTFTANSSVLPTRYKRLSPQAITRFSADQLCKQPMQTIFAQTLNILGKRLVESSLASITVMCFTQENAVSGVMSSLSTERVNTIREYLRGVWSIAPERIVGKEQMIAPTQYSPEDAQMLARTLQFQSATQEIFRPLQEESLSTLADISALAIDLDIRTGQGLKEWSLEISQFEDREIRTLGLFKGTKEFPKNVVWTMSEEAGSMPTVGGSLMLKLEATDLANRSIDAVPVEISIDAASAAQNAPLGRREQYKFFYDTSQEQSLQSRMIPDLRKRTPAQRDLRVSAPKTALTPQFVAQLAERLGVEATTITLLPQEPLAERLREDEFPLQNTITLEILQKEGK